MSQMSWGNALCHAKCFQFISITRCTNLAEGGDDDIYSYQRPFVMQHKLQDLFFDMHRSCIALPSVIHIKTFFPLNTLQLWKYVKENVSSVHLQYKCTDLISLLFLILCLSMPRGVLILFWYHKEIPILSYWFGFHLQWLRLVIFNICVTSQKK